MYPKLSALLIEHDIDLDSMLNDSGTKETPINDDQPKPAIEVNSRKNDREDSKTRGLNSFRNGLQNAAFGWSCNFTNVSLNAPGNLEFKGKAARFDGITIKNHILWWDDWSFVETLREFAIQEYPALEPIASSEFGSDYVAPRLSNLRCLTPDGGKAWSWGEIALLLESLDRKQFSTFGTLWLSPDGTKAGYHTDCLVEVLENCYTTPDRPVKSAIKGEVGADLSTKALEAIVAGGFGGVVQAAASVPAKDRYTQVMRNMLKGDVKYYEWIAQDWVDCLGASKPTIIGCDGWREIMERKETQKQASMPVKTAMEKAESNRRKKRKKLAE